MKCCFMVITRSRIPSRLTSPSGSSYQIMRRRVLILPGVVFLTLITLQCIYFYDTSTSYRINLDMVDNIKRTSFESTPSTMSPNNQSNSSTPNSRDVTGREFLRRLQKYQDVCDKEKDDVIKHGWGKHILASFEHNFSLCFTPKTGSTLWKRMLHFINKDTGQHSATSFRDVTRLYVHLESSGEGTVFDLETDRAKIMKTQRAMFTRDPYSRLWAVYVDKFLLPDSWLDHGRKIVRRRKTTVGVDQGSKNQSERCGNDVTFAELLKYSLVNQDSHWSPISHVCNPCRFKPHFIGKVETFDRDTAFILEETSLKHLLYDETLTQRHISLSEDRNTSLPFGQPTMTSTSSTNSSVSVVSNLSTLLSITNHSSIKQPATSGRSRPQAAMTSHRTYFQTHVEDQTYTIIDYHLTKWYRSSSLQSCLSLGELIQRLWSVFQINGYLPLNNTFPSSQLESIHFRKIHSVSKMTRYISNLVMKQTNKLIPSFESWIRYKRQKMIEAYSKIPITLLEKIATHFSKDFKLFDYDMYPEDIFNRL